ncbi:hypothetical protein [Kineosporia sp. NBRC 101731]|uniref:hypothetical protein n=1 Tax=Kineosporia sp. NBRC 101731 TaxID=3032199 RepID=UPI002552E168|nr:hypothetical protein [Kineosporia sp. NBRC 101731]
MFTTKVLTFLLLLPMAGGVLSLLRSIYDWLTFLVQKPVDEFVLRQGSKVYVNWVSLPLGTSLSAGLIGLALSQFERAFTGGPRGFNSAVPFGVFIAGIAVAVAMPIYVDNKSRQGLDLLASRIYEVVHGSDFAGSPSVIRDEIKQNLFDTRRRYERRFRRWKWRAILASVLFGILLLSCIFWRVGWELFARHSSPFAILIVAQLVSWVLAKKLRSNVSVAYNEYLNALTKWESSAGKRERKGPASRQNLSVVTMAAAIVCGMAIESFRSRLSGG